MAENIEEKKRYHWLSKLAMTSIIIIIVTFCLLLASEGKSKLLENIFTIICGVFLIVTILAAIIGLLIISINDKYKGIGESICLIIFITFILFQFSPLIPYRHNPIGGRVMCSTNLSGLGKALLTYANDHNGYLPDANWCDKLILYADTTPDQFICPNSEALFGESTYVLNKEVVGKKISEIPEDMVVLFETNYGIAESGRTEEVKNRQFTKHGDWSTKLNQKVYENRWNQVGGPEYLTLEYHRFDGGNILYADLHAKFERSFKELRWKIDGSKADFTVSTVGKVMPKPVLRFVAVGLIGLIVLIATYFILRKYFNIQYITFGIILALISGWVGAFFGNWAQHVYSYNGQKLYDVGIISGGISGMIVGIWYAMILAGTPTNIKQQKGFGKYATAMGMLTGIICSTVVHINLMIIDAEPLPYGIMAGIAYAIIPSAILGRICAAIVKRFSKQELIEILQTQGEKNEQ